MWQWLSKIFQMEALQRIEVSCSVKMLIRMLTVFNFWLFFYLFKAKTRVWLIEILNIDWYLQSLEWNAPNISYKDFLWRSKFKRKKKLPIS